MIEGALERRREGKNGMVVLPKEGEQNFPCDKSEEIFKKIKKNIYYLWEDLMKSI